jgi:hypothetical protein
MPRCRAKAKSTNVATSAMGTADTGRVAMTALTALIANYFEEGE